MCLKVPQSLIFAFRMILAVLFLTSALGKLVDLERYSVDAVYNFGILPMILARPFALVLPFLELLCAGGLLFGIFTRLAALGIGLMSLFEGLNNLLNIIHIGRVKRLFRIRLGIGSRCHH